LGTWHTHDVKRLFSFYHDRNFKRGDPCLNVQVKAGFCRPLIVGVHQGANVPHTPFVSKQVKINGNPKRSRFGSAESLTLRP